MLGIGRRLALGGSVPMADTKAQNASQEDWRGKAKLA